MNLFRYLEYLHKLRDKCIDYDYYNKQYTTEEGVKMQYEIYPTNSLIIQKVMNGHRVTVKGTREMQDDNENGEYVFASLQSLLVWVEKYYNNLAKVEAVKKYER